MANSEMIALGVIPYRSSGNGRPLRTFNTTMIATKKQRLAVQLRISIFHGSELHVVDDRRVALIDGFDSEWDGPDSERGSSVSWRSSDDLNSSSSCGADCIAEDPVRCCILSWLLTEAGL